MERILKKVIRQEGLSVLSLPAQVREKLEENGAKREEALRWELLLTACPNAAMLASRQEVTPAELNAVIAAAVQTTELHPMRVRKMMGQLLRAAEAKLPPMPISLDKQPRFRGTIEVPEEEKLLEKAYDASDGQPETALTTLQTLSDNGNGHASYCLGKFFREKTVEGVDGPATAQGYFEKAARQGYGPAYGALAEYALQGKKKQLEQAARYFAQPNALVGKNGKEWSKNAAALLDYREHNLTQGKTALRIAVLALVCTLAACVLANLPWLILALLAEAACVLVCIVNLLLRPYASYRTVYGVLAVCWLLGGILSILF